MSTEKNKNNLPKIVVILGPTATGKTKLAVKLAQKFNGEIVSADSRQVYREMDIGTGKDLAEYELFFLPPPSFCHSDGSQNPEKNKMKNSGSRVVARDDNKIVKIPYHLINIINPNQKFNVAKYKKLALKAIKDILNRGKLPIIVGGTGLYISAIIDNYNIPQIKPDKKVREKLARMKLVDKVNLLKKLDPASLQFMDLKNARRLDRALEVCLAGYKFSELRQKGEPIFDALQIGIKMERSVINKRINKRVEAMIKNGLLEETKNIIKKFGKKSAPLQTIGYKEIVDYLQKNVGAQNLVPLQKTINLIKIHTRQFAKRQMTWFFRDRNIKWIKDEKQTMELIKRFLI